MDLKFLFKLCRAYGVNEITHEGTTIKFGDMPNKRSRSPESSDEIPSDGLTPDQLLFYSSNPPTGDQ